MTFASNGPEYGWRGRIVRMLPGEPLAKNTRIRSMRENLGNPMDLVRIGDRLRKAREDQGRSVALAAEELCLTKATVAALEEGDWSRLPHPLYVKGYIKSYALLLKITPLIDLHAAGDSPSRHRGSADEEDPVQDRLMPTSRKARMASACYPLLYKGILVFLATMKALLCSTLSPRTTATADLKTLL
jgi:hypothetical protein